MISLVIDLTNRCNLKCTHCFNARHNADGDLDIKVLDTILSHAKDIQYLSFTGGEPTLHPEFEPIIRMTAEAGHKFGFVTNGWNFPNIYEKIMPYRENLLGVTFSLDGAHEGTHDHVRGLGSFHRLMQAVSVCILKNISFTFNTLITTNNAQKLHDTAILAAKLGARGLRFGHLIPTSLSIKKKLCVSPDKRVSIDYEIRSFKDTVNIPVVLAPGYHTKDIFPCSALQFKEIDIDWQGNVTVCCHLTGQDTCGHDHIVGNLREISFAEAYKRWTRAIQVFRDKKENEHAAGRLNSADYFPCWYCGNYFKKVDWMKEFPENPWTRSVWNNNNQRRANT